MTPSEIEVSYHEVPEQSTLSKLPGPFDVVAISSFTAQIKEAYHLANQYRDAGVTVLMGGLHVTARPEEALNHCDSVLIGEGESLWPQMMADLQKNRLKGTSDNSLDISFHEDLDFLNFGLLRDLDLRATFAALRSIFSGFLLV